MAKKRSTIDVATVLDMTNRYLASDNKMITPEMREGAAAMLSNILHLTGNYHGFNYLEWVNGGFAKWEAAGRPEDNTPFLGDQSRKVYHSAPITGSKNKHDFPMMLD